MIGVTIGAVGGESQYDLGFNAADMTDDLRNSLRWRGLVEGEVDSSTELRPKKVFRPTGAGTATLRAWLVRRGLEWREDPSNRDLRFETDLDRPISEVMTSENLVTVGEGTSLEAAEDIVQFRIASRHQGQRFGADLGECGRQLDLGAF